MTVIQVTDLPKALDGIIYCEQQIIFDITKFSLVWILPTTFFQVIDLACFKDDFSNIVSKLDKLYNMCKIISFSQCYNLPTSQIRSINFTRRSRKYFEAIMVRSNFQTLISFEKDCCSDSAIICNMSKTSPYPVKVGALAFYEQSILLLLQLYQADFDKLSNLSCYKSESVHFFVVAVVFRLLGDSVLASKHVSLIYCFLKISSILSLILWSIFLFGQYLLYFDICLFLYTNVVVLGLILVFVILVFLRLVQNNSSTKW